MNSITILLAIGIFLIVIWILVAVLLYARKKLVPEGKVKILLNKDKVIEQERGCTVLQALSENNIFLPSACGGGGTCGTCKGKILSGCDTLLPTEKVHITPKLEKENYHLFCQVKVKNDLDLEIPPEILGVKKWNCEVVSNKNVATFIKELVVKLPEGEFINFQSGGYIQIDIPPCQRKFSEFDIDNDYREDWERMNLFSLTMKNKVGTVRAYSMANHPKENDRIILNVRIATPPFDKKKNDFMRVNPGVASSYVYGLKPKDMITISGPYGEFFIRNTQHEMMFIGGGAGMAPMRSHIFNLFKTEQTKRKVSFWYGGRSLKELFYIDEFQDIENKFDNFNFHLALSEPKPEDNWSGNVGFIHQVIYEQYLKLHPAPEDIEYYICGPPMMLQAVLRMLDQLGVSKEMIYYDDFGG